MTGTSSLSSSRACAVVLVLIDSFASFQFFRESRKNCQYLVEPVKIQPSVLCTRARTSLPAPTRMGAAGNTNNASRNRNIFSIFVQLKNLAWRIILAPH